MLSIGAMDASPKPSESLETAKKAAGGATGLANALKERGIEISSQAISQWARVPAERVLAVEAATGVPRHELRPDLYPPEPARRAS